MQKKAHVSFDLETFGRTRVDQVVLVIGACAFDIESGGEIGTFVVNIDWQSSIDAGRTIHPETLRWWMSQSDAARKAVCDTSGAIAIAPALYLLSDWLRDVGCEFVWGNGATFDIGILQHMYEQRQLKIPWEFRKVRDLRTLVHVAQQTGFDSRTIPSVGTHHNALDDARFQAHVITAAWKHLSTRIVAMPLGKIEITGTLTSPTTEVAPCCPRENGEHHIACNGGNPPVVKIPPVEKACTSNNGKHTWNDGSCTWCCALEEAFPGENAALSDF